MARIDELSVVIDAGPLIHLDELECLDLLSDYSSLVTTDIVWDEAQRHRTRLQPRHIPGLQIAPVSGHPSTRLSVLSDTLDLAAGEISALVLAEQHNLKQFLTDDAAARVTGESLGLQVHGTIGIVVRAIRYNRRTRDEVLEMLKSIPKRSTLHLSKSLLSEVIRRVEVK